MEAMSGKSSRATAMMQKKIERPGFLPGRILWRWPNWRGWSSYDITPHFAINVGYMHAFQNSITSTGTNLASQPTSVKSTLSENGVDLV